MPNTHHTVASIVRCLLDVLADDGHDIAALASRLNFDLASLRTPQATISVNSFDPLWQMVYDTHGPVSGLVAGKRIKLIDLQDLGIYLAATEDVTDWMQQFDRYVQLVSEVVDLNTQVSRRGLDVQMSYKVELPLLYERLDFVAIMGLVLISQYLDHPLKPARVELTRPRPADPRPWDEAFASEVIWDAPITKIVIGYKEASRLLLTRDTQLRQVLSSLLNLRLRKRKANDPLNRVRVEIGAQLEQAPTLDSVASSLNMSKRALQRVLKNEDTTFSELLTQARKDMAENLLTAGVPIQEVYELLGYSDQSVFQRAFKQWMGLTPAEFVAKHQAEELTG